MNEQTKADIMEQVEETLFFTKELNNIIFEVVEEMEQATIGEFMDFFEYKTNEGTEADRIKWELLKNYTIPEEVHKINYNEILQNFYNDIKKILEVNQWEQ